jgi:hypothetical protein
LQAPPDQLTHMEDAYVEELQAECRQLRAQVAAMAAKLIVGGSQSEYGFEVISFVNGKQVHHLVRDVYYPPPGAPAWERARIIIS